jgi:hypothetical protein
LLLALCSLLSCDVGAKKDTRVRFDIEGLVVTAGT